MNEQRTEKRRVPAWGRLLLVSVVGLLVVGTGIVLVPRDSGTPQAVPFSEAARVEALEDTLRLRESANALAETGGADAGKPAVDDSVTLLTTQARALMEPAGKASPSPAPVTRPADTGTTRTAFVTALSESGRKRLGDARTSDGGMARLLAAVGTAQMLQAEKLAAAWKLEAPKQPLLSESGAPVTPPAASCPSASPTPDPGAATTDTALAAMVRAHQEAVYAYQVALKRLDSAAVSAAAKELHVHEASLQQAEELTRANCGDVPASEAGYRLPEQFAKNPTGSLAALESSSLPRFGDLVALSAGETRVWAIEGLLAAARRSTQWGANLTALPGLVFDAGDLPSLPTSSGAGTPTAGSR